jgi:hypothetical protein
MRYERITISNGPVKTPRQGTKQETKPPIKELQMGTGLLSL